ncbi:18950_t:CDS:2 [Dentiscutata erythropus]|uniref:18950_t:CDS:1 n=1 Tax=Dentiscutata erythropus TaxID=1348616 RepID=A0A9N9BTL5_9GLOM|nr:18950_t:CDS:2 [Dentiscutata erythropus]
MAKARLILKISDKLGFIFSATWLYNTQKIKVEKNNSGDCNYILGFVWL